MRRVYGADRYDEEEALPGYLGEIERPEVPVRELEDHMIKLGTQLRLQA
ncbi:hypothetical protein [Thermococcus sp.]|nr:hypothetical protein [Thermococcus sp.]